MSVVPPMSDSELLARQPVPFLARLAPLTEPPHPVTFSIHCFSSANYNKGLAFGEGVSSARCCYYWYLCGCPPGLEGTLPVGHEVGPEFSTDIHLGES